MDSILSVAVVIPTHNRKRLLEILLTQIKNQIKETFIINTYVVVDESGSDTLLMLQKIFTEVKPILGTGDWWYTKSINEGMKESVKDKNDLILILNDDIELPNNYIKNLVNSYKEVGPNCIIGSTVYTIDKPHRLLSSGVRKINWFFFKMYFYHRSFQIMEPGSLIGNFPSVVLSGRGILIPSFIASTLNYFDEKFVQYHSDFDFCLRAKKNLFEVYISWGSYLFSHHKLTSSSTSYVANTFSDFIKSFFNKYSRRYLPITTRFFLRHSKPHYVIFTIVMNILGNIKSFVVKKIKNFYGIETY